MTINRGSSTPTGGLVPIEETDSNFFIVDNVDATSRLRFEVGNISSGATRVITVPDQNLSLGTLSEQDFDNVSITGGSITGITDLAVADGGTGASTASGARTNLDVYSTGEVDALTWDTSDIVSGTFSDARIAQSNVTQHEGAITITESQISDLQNYSLVGHTHVFSDITDTIADGQVPVSAVTQHEGSLTITESQISDLGTYVPQSRTLTAGSGLTGGGDLSANRTFSVDYASQAQAEAGTDNDQVITALRVAQYVNQFGLGTGQNYSGDLNNLVDPGFYWADGSSTNRPASSTGSVFVNRLPGNTYTSQIFFESNISPASAYFRVEINGTWTGWQKILRSADLAANGGTLLQSDQQETVTDFWTFNPGTVAADVARIENDSQTGRWLRIRWSGTGGTASKLTFVPSNNADSYAFGLEFAYNFDDQKWGFSDDLDVGGGLVVGSPSGASSPLNGDIHGENLYNNGNATLDVSNLAANGGTIPETNRGNVFSSDQTISNGVPNLTLEDPTDQSSRITFKDSAGTNKLFIYDWTVDEFRWITGGNARMTLVNNGGLVMQGATGGNQGIGTINAAQSYNNGNATLDTSDLTSNGGTVPETDQDESVSGNWEFEFLRLSDRAADSDVWRLYESGADGAFLIQRFDVGSGNGNLGVGEIGTDGGLVWGTVATGGSQGAGTINASGIYDDGVLVLTDITGENIGDLSDVSATAPSDGDVLTWNNANSEWEPQASSGGSLTESSTRVELGGDFNAGAEVVCTRIGSMVTITSDGNLGHSDLANPESAAGIIPTTYRPDTSVRNITNLYTAGSPSQKVSITTTGELQLLYQDNTFSSTTTTLSTPFTITYNLVDETP